MPKVIIRYRTKRALQALKDLAKYFDYSVTDENADSARTSDEINGVAIITGSGAADALRLKGSLTGSKLSLKEIRNRVWKRK